MITKTFSEFFESEKSSAMESGVHATTAVVLLAFATPFAPFWRVLRDQ